MSFQGWPMNSDWLMLGYKEPAGLPRFETTLKGHLSSRVSHRMAEASVIIALQASSSLPSPAFLGYWSSSANTPLNTFCTQLSESVFPWTPIWDAHLTHFFQKPLFFFFSSKLLSEKILKSSFTWKYQWLIIAQWVSFPRVICCLWESYIKA